MGEVEWIKLYPKIFRSSRKIDVIEHMKGGDTILVIWFKLLCLAGEINHDGVIYVTPDIPYSVKSLAERLGRPRAIVDTALKVFSEYGMIFRDDAGFIRIANWEKYQNTSRMAEIREQTNARVKRCRDKKRQDGNVSCNVTSSVTVTPDVTECNAIEEDKDKDNRDIRDSIYITPSSEDMDNNHTIFPLPLDDGSEFYINHADVEDWKRAYIGVDVEGELRRMRAWLDANPGKRKTVHQIKAFVVGWLNRTNREAADRNAVAIKEAAARDPRLPKNQPSGNGTFETDEFFEASVRQTFGEDFDFDLLKKQQ